MQELFDVQLNETDTPMSVSQMQDALETADAFCPTVSDNVNAEQTSAVRRGSVSR